MDIYKELTDIKRLLQGLSRNSGSANKSRDPIPNKWVNINHFTTYIFSSEKTRVLCNAGLIEKRNVGRNVLINLQKFNEDMDNDVFEDIDLSNVYKNK